MPFISELENILSSHVDGEQPDRYTQCSTGKNYDPWKWYLNLHHLICLPSEKHFSESSIFKSRNVQCESRESLKSED